GLEVEILGEAELEKLGFRTLLAVGQGSERESQVAIMKWNGGKPGEQPIAFVGKGVCFDTGGISIKPADGMEEMKWDMGGSAAVAGLMHALAGRKAKVNAVGVIGLDRKSTRLNSSHVKISYAVFCLKKKKTARSTGAAAGPARPARAGTGGGRPRTACRGCAPSPPRPVRRGRHGRWRVTPRTALVGL